MEAVAIRDDQPSMNGKEEWGTTKKNSHKITTKKPHNVQKTEEGKNLNPVAPKALPATQLPVHINIKAATGNDELGTIPPPRKPDTEGEGGQSKDYIVCWKCHVVCKNARGLKIHQHACLRKVAGGASFFRDERFDLNRKTQQKESHPTSEQKILPPSQPLIEALTSNNNKRTSDVK